MIRTYVLVHGAFCSAAAWGPVARELTLRGHRAVAVDLPGHGLSAQIPQGYLSPQNAERLATERSGMASIGTAEDVAAVVEVVRRAREHGPVVLAGVSRGGLTVTAVANTVPDLLDWIVYISAWCCVTATTAEYMDSPENATSLYGAAAATMKVADTSAVGAVRLNWRTDDPAVLDALQEALLADGTRAELLAYLHSQDPDESVHVDEDAVRVNPATWGRIPHSYVRLAADRALPLALQDRFIVEADTVVSNNRFDVHTLPHSHLGVQLHPRELVQILEALPV